MLGEISHSAAFNPKGFLFSNKNVSPSHECSIPRLVDEGDLLETKGWAVVQLSDSDGVCRSALPLAVVLGGKPPGGWWGSTSMGGPGEAACREARSIRRFTSAEAEVKPNLEFEFECFSKG